MTERLCLTLLPYRLTVCRLPAESPLPEAPPGARFFSVTRTEEELSLVMAETDLLPGLKRCQKGWNAFKVKGPLAFEMTGVLSSLTTPLANHDIPVFALSTYDTDYLLVPCQSLKQASRCLKQAGFQLAVA